MERSQMLHELTMFYLQSQPIEIRTPEELVDKYQEVLIKIGNQFSKKSNEYIQDENFTF